MYNTIIGIDVSKDDFVVARYGCKDTKTFSNSPGTQESSLKISSNQS